LIGEEKGRGGRRGIGAEARVPARREGTGAVACSPLLSSPLLSGGVAEVGKRRRWGGESNPNPNDIVGVACGDVFFPPHPTPPHPDGTASPLPWAGLGP